MSKSAILLTLTVSIALAACGGTDEAAALDAPSADWESLMTSAWTAEAGAETNVCTRWTVAEDITFGAIQVVSPPQTRLILLTLGAPDGPDGVSECAPLDGHETLLYAAGPTSEPFILPDRVGMHVPAGSQLLLNIQVANPEPDEQPGSVNVYVKPVDGDRITANAEAVLMDHAPGSVPSLCTMGHDSFPFAVALQAAPTSVVTMVAKSSFSGDVTLFDAPVADSQVHLLDGPVGMSAGELVELSCVVGVPPNGRSGPDPTDASDCLAAIYRYPVQPGASWWCEG